jgi:hypothetical protein
MRRLSALCQTHRTHMPRLSSTVRGTAGGAILLLLPLL